MFHFRGESAARTCHLLIDSGSVWRLSDVRMAGYSSCRSRKAYEVTREKQEVSRRKRACLKVRWVLALTFGLIVFGGESFLPTASSCGSYLAGGGVQCSQKADCGKGFYCEKAVGDCDGEGRCSSKPEVCMELYKPVCGCDGKTHSNACKAAQAGVSVNHDGPCAP